MKERTDRIATLLEKYLQKELSSEEQTELDVWLLEGNDNMELFQQLTNQDQLLERLRIYDLADGDAIWEQTMNKIHPGAKVVSFPKKRTAIYKYAAAAAVVAVISVVAYFIGNGPVSENPSQARNEQSTSPVKSDGVVPGGKYAELVLADGSKVQLDKAPDGNLIQQGPMQLSKADGLLTYSGRFITSGPVSTGAEKHASLHNMVSTPRGGQYQITLPDGSKVWLNAASSLRFPLAFAGNQRVVELTGEAYFEIKRLSLPGSDEKMPFIVKVAGKNSGYEVEVLGTHFNVMAHEDENAVRTTLLEGSVRVKKGTANAILSPGQQAVSQNGELKVVDVHAEDAITWRNSITIEGNLETVINQIARWYDVEVVYEGKSSESKKQQDVYGGILPLDTKFDVVIKVLETQGIHTSLEHRKLSIKQ